MHKNKAHRWSASTLDSHQAQLSTVHEEACL